ncbi:MAG: glycerophosphodiester phosphodiesterase, partial [Desulfurococcaceae archaeon]
MKIKVIGHRGAPMIYPENTISSIIKAIELKVDGVEVDVRSTWDNVLVLFHDEKLDRLIGVSKYLSEVTY